MTKSLFCEPVDAVLFDFDGTLVDASAAICSAFRTALGGASTISDEDIRKMIGRPLRDMFLAIQPNASQREVDGFFTRYRDAFFPLASTQTYPLPGAVEALERLVKVASLGIVTTRLSDGAIRMLRAHNMLDYFSCIVGLEHVSQAKPDPEPVQLALRMLERCANRAVMVGDTPDDIMAGKRAGTGTVGVTTGAFDRTALEEAGADIVIQSLSDLDQQLRG